MTMGRLEMTLRITDEETGRVVDTTTTVAMWARADEARDRLRRYRPGMSSGWYGERFLNLIWMLAAEREGMTDTVADLSTGEGAYAALLAFIDRFAVEIVEEPEGEDGADPSTGAPGDAPDAREDIS